MSILEERHKQDVRRVKKLLIITPVIILVFTLLIMLGVIFHKVNLYLSSSIMEGLTFLFLMLVISEKLELSHQKV